MNSMISLFAIIFSLVSLIISLAAIVIVLAQKWSTHKIEWKPLELNEETASSEEVIAEKEDEDILFKALELQKKKRKQEDPLDAVAETSNF